MPAESDRWEARNCKEIDKYTLGNGVLHIARAYLNLAENHSYFVKRMTSFIFSVFFLWRESLFFFFFFLFLPFLAKNILAVTEELGVIRGR